MGSLKVGSGTQTWIPVFKISYSVQCNPADDSREITKPRRGFSKSTHESFFLAYFLSFLGNLPSIKTNASCFFVAEIFKGDAAKEEEGENPEGESE